MIDDIEKIENDDYSRFGHVETDVYTCRVCRHDRHFGPYRYSHAFQVCTDCAEAIANVWHRQHSGQFLTWPEPGDKKGGA